MPPQMTVPKVSRIYYIPSEFADREIIARYLNNDAFEVVAEVEDAQIAIFPTFDSMNQVIKKHPQIICICANADAGSKWNTKQPEYSFIHCASADLPIAISLAMRKLEQS
jgi:hypothetical protein